VNWKALKSKGITEVYIRCAEENLEAISTFLPAIKAAGLKPYAWTWQGFTMYEEAVAKGWHISADIENYNILDYLYEIKYIRCVTKVAGKTFILCTKAQDWDGDQKWSVINKYCDYIQPMLYLGDLNKSLTDLKNYMEAYNNKYPGKIYPALETYVSDLNPVPKTKAVLDAEIAACAPYCEGVSLFRYGISNFDNTPVPTVPTVPTIDKTIQQKLKDLGYYTGTVDGKLGPYTVAAIKAFQTANGLVADGVVGPLTKAKLFPVSYPAGFKETSGLHLYRQTTGYTCGPSSLKMCLSRYGISAYEMTLASYAGSTSTAGSTHAGLINATKRTTSTLTLLDKSFSSVGWSGVYNYIKSNVPVICHLESFLNPGVSGHYVVIFGIDMNNKQVKLGDPSYGVRTVSFATMESKMRWVLNTGRATTNLMPLVRA
jgi:hypothetical protein